MLKCATCGDALVLFACLGGYPITFSFTNSIFMLRFFIV